MAKSIVEPAFLKPLSPAWLEWRIGGARQGAADTAIDSRPFINCVRDLKDHRAWERYFKNGAKTWERFCEEVLDTKAEFVDQVQRGVEALEAAGHFGAIPEKQALDAAAKVQARADNAKDLSTTGAQPNNKNANKSLTGQNKGNNITFVLPDKANKCNRRGTDPEYLTARIARDHPDILKRMKAGEYKSVRAAAKDAGIIREPTALEKAQKLWLKMTAKERAAFQKWMEAQ